MSDRMMDVCKCSHTHLFIANDLTKVNNFSCTQILNNLETSNSSCQDLLFQNVEELWVNKDSSQEVHQEVSVVVIAEVSEVVTVEDSVVALEGVTVVALEVEQEVSVAVTVEVLEVATVEDSVAEANEDF